ncbi:MAG: bifunctional phosphopantothenoylcysteine decarboxylase/phosphopantothenate--cysteine ligase CoaBC [Candidatus Bathyarchaeia archaeon]
MNRHPSKDIVGRRGSELKGRKIVLCITGSVAAVKSPEIARELMRHGAEVYAVMTEAAQKIIHPNLMEWATGNPVITELTGKIEHVALAGNHQEKADLVLVAPATANTISKIASGIDDTPVTSFVSAAFGSKIPIIIVPAMHESMYRHPIVAANIEKLKSFGVEFVGPKIEEGKAKIADVEDVVSAVIRKIAYLKDLLGKKILITAGPTLEYIDPVRVLTNKSSGKMGVAIAEEALYRGAEVTLIYGRGTVPPPAGVRVINVETTKEMYDAVVEELQTQKYDAVIACGAPADFTLEKPFESKIPTLTTPELTLKLKSTPKIIEAVKQISPNTFLVAFKAEYRMSNEEIIESAYKTLKASNADLIVANDVGRRGAGFGADTNEVFIIDKDRNIIHIPLTAKREVAEKLLDNIVKKL